MQADISRFALHRARAHVIHIQTRGHHADTLMMMMSIKVSMPN